MLITNYQLLVVRWVDLRTVQFALYIIYIICIVLGVVYLKLFDPSFAQIQTAAVSCVFPQGMRRRYIFTMESLILAQDER